MSLTYKDLINTNFPDEIDVFENKQDVSADNIDIVNEYKGLVEQGKTTEAEELFKNNEESLKNVIITANDLNKIQDALMAVQRIAKREQQQIRFSETQPAGEYEQAIGDIWMQLSQYGWTAHEKTGDDVYTERPMAAMGGCWIDFVDENGIPTDEPWIHWMAPDET